MQNSSLLINEPVAHLPSGWKKEEYHRPNGLSSGQSIVYYVSSKGVKVTNPKQMQALLGNKYDLSSFDWQTGKFITHGQKIKRSECLTENNNTIKNRFSPYTRVCQYPINLKPKIISNCLSSKCNDDKTVTATPPHQLLWEKRIKNLRPIDSETGENISRLRLPKFIQSAGVIGINRDQVLMSLISAIASKNIPIIGQEQQQSDIEKNPCAALNHNQPLIKPYTVTEEDIRKQETRVRDLRRKLQNMRGKIHQKPITQLGR